MKYTKMMLLVQISVMKLKTIMTVTGCCVIYIFTYPIILISSKYPFIDREIASFINNHRVRKLSLKSNIYFKEYNSYYTTNYRLSNLIECDVLSIVECTVGWSMSESRLQSAVLRR